MGWGRCGLCWWPIEGGSVKVVLDTSSADDLLQLSSICGFACTVFGARHANYRQVIRAAYFGQTVVPDGGRRLLKGVSQVQSCSKRASGDTYDRSVHLHVLSSVPLH